MIDDYGHHPVEIRAVLAAAREGVKGPRHRGGAAPPLHAPRDHMEDFESAFNDADVVYAAPVYAAGEQPIEGVDSDHMVSGMKARGHRSAQVIAGPDALADALATSIQPGDMSSALARATSPSGPPGLPMPWSSGGPLERGRKPS